MEKKKVTKKRIIETLKEEGVSENETPSSFFVPKKTAEQGYICIKK